VDTCKHTVFFF